MRTASVRRGCRNRLTHRGRRDNGIPFLLVRQPNDIAIGVAAHDAPLDQTAVPPDEIDRVAAARPQTCHAPFRPRRRQGWQKSQNDLAVRCPFVALQQHLGNCRRAAKVAVDLERRMRIEEVRIRAALVRAAQGRKCRGKLVLKNRVGVVAIVKTRPPRHAPRHAPARGDVAAMHERLLRGGEERGRLRRDLRRRIEGVEVGDVAVLVLRVVQVFRPLLKLTPTANLQRRQPRTTRRQLGKRRRIVRLAAEHLRRRRNRVKEITQNLRVHRGPARPLDAVPPLRRVFGRIARHDRQEAGLRILDERIDEELGRAAHDGVGACEERPVLREEPMIPELGREPRAAHRPPAEGAVHGDGEPPDVRVVVRTPAACAIHVLRRPCTRDGHLLQRGQQRLGERREVRDIDRPVVHLQVDVDRVARHPRRNPPFVPDALQCRRLRARLGGRNEQVASKREVERGQVRIARVPKRLEPRGSRQARLGIRQVEPTRVELRPVFRDVARAQGVIGKGRGLCETAVAACLLVAGRAVLPVDEARGRRIEERDGRRAAHEQDAIVGRHLAIRRIRLQVRRIPNRALRIVRDAGAAREEKVASIVRRTHLALERALEERRERERLRTVGLQANDHDIVRKRREHLAPIGHAARRVDARGDGLLQRKGAAVGCRQSLSVEAKDERAERLVGLGRVPARNQPAGRPAEEREGFLLLPVQDQPTNLRQDSLQPRLQHVVGASIPKRVLVELQALRTHPAEHHRAQASVAERQGLVPRRRRRLVVERERRGDGPRRKRQASDETDDEETTDRVHHNHAHIIAERTRIR